jgi:arylsulfatase A-like enzyme
MRGPLAAGQWAIVGALLTALMAAPADGSAEAQPQLGAAAPFAEPDIVFIQMDDLRYDDLPWLPTVERRIGQTGTRFTNFYAPLPLCCPSRVSTLRGQYPHNTGVLTNSEPGGGFAGSLAVDGSTLATWLDPTYRTGYVGKYLNGYDSPTQMYIPPGWDDWEATVRTYHYTRVRTNDNGVIRDYSGTNSPEVLGALAEAFIVRQAFDTEPYFLHLSFLTPHTGRPHTDDDGGVQSAWVPPRDRGTYVGPLHPPDPSYNEPDVSDKTGPIADYPPLTAREQAKLELRNVQRRESLASADRAIAGVLNTLEQMESLSDTVIIFTSDNGQMLGEHRVPKYKDLPYEPSARLPFMLTGPGIPQRNVWTGPAGTHDIAPTILDAAGVGADIAMDGRSVLPTEQRPDGDRARAIVLEGTAAPVDPEDGGATRYVSTESADNADWKYHAVVTRRWKLISWDQRGTHELYDLRADPYELQNVYGERQFRQVQRRLTARLEALWLCSAHECGSR